MRILLFADLHLDAPFAWLAHRPHVARQRRQALRETLRRIVALADECRAEALLCAGDLYEHEYYTPDTAAFVRRTFEAVYPLRVFIAPGNHDWYGPGSLYHQTAWPDNVHVFRDARLEPVTLADGLTLWGAAHRAPANTPSFLESFQVDRGGVHVALFHGSERESLAAQGSEKVPHAPFHAEQIPRAGLHHAFLGHYHCPRDDAWFTYPGNPDPLTFGETGERGAVLATIEPDGAVRRERRRVAQSVVHDIVVDVTGCASQQDVRDRVVETLQGRCGVARVTLRGDLAPDADLRPLDLHDAWLDALLVRAEAVRAAYDFDAIAREPTVRGRFVRDVQAADLPEDERRRILVTGLRALAGRDDLEVE